MRVTRSFTETAQRFTEKEEKQSLSSLRESLCFSVYLRVTLYTYSNTTLLALSKVAI